MIPQDVCGLPGEVQEKLNSVFRKYLSIDRVTLYGSRAKGTHKPASDIDLTIFSAEMGFEEFVKVLEDLDELLLPFKIDLSIFSSIDNESLKEHILRVGMTFYEKKSHLP